MSPCPPDRDPHPGAILQDVYDGSAPARRLADRLSASPASPWKRRACTGSRSTRSWRRAASRCCLVNARHVKNVPGRKSDVSDCEWMRELHIVGLLRGSFRPTRRHRRAARLSPPSADAAGERRHLHPAHAEGARADESATAGRWSATSPASPASASCATSSPASATRSSSPRIATIGVAPPAEIVAALTGHYRPEHLFVLQQNLELFDMCQAQLAACDRAIEAHVQTLTAPLTPPPRRCPPPRVTDRKPRDNAPTFDIRAPAPSPHRWRRPHARSMASRRTPPSSLLAEIGTDMSRWPTEKHFTSWLTLAPKNKISGGRLLSSRTATLRQSRRRDPAHAAMSLSRTQTALGAFYRLCMANSKIREHFLPVSRSW